LAAGMAAVAERYPSVIEKAITRKPDGTLSVRLYQPGTLTPVDIQVNPDLPARSGSGYKGGLVYAHGHNTHHLESWPAVIEKAIEGGYPRDTMLMLTGRPGRAMSLDPSPVQEGSAWTAMLAAHKAGKPMAASTYSDEEFPSVMQRFAQSDPKSPVLKYLHDLH